MDIEHANKQKFGFWMKFYFFRSLPRVSRIQIWAQNRNLKLKLACDTQENLHLKSDKNDKNWRVQRGQALYLTRQRAGTIIYASQFKRVFFNKIISLAMGRAWLLHNRNVNKNHTVYHGIFQFCMRVHLKLCSFLSGKMCMQYLQK